MCLPVIAIYDFGRTNKRLFLLNEQYRIVWAEEIQLAEIEDEDGFACEDLKAITTWLQDSFEKIKADKRFTIKAVNFSAYGASFVHLNQELKPVLPLYNYLKPYPEELQQQFYKTYGGATIITRETASPVLENLNAGMQLYWLKHTQSKAYSQIKYSLYLPQYLSFLLCKKACTDITSIGCHTTLWNFEKSDYHDWVNEENIKEKFAPIVPCTRPLGTAGHHVLVGTGLHNHSSALIPYLTFFHEPFVLLSTGNWCISLNPFADAPLSNSDLKNNCLYYLSYQKKPVKASRLFAGNDHERQVKRLAAHFNKPLNHYESIKCDKKILSGCHQVVYAPNKKDVSILMKPSAFSSRDLYSFISYEEAYHQLLMDIVTQQKLSTSLVLKGTPAKRIFVEGAFSKNVIYMHLMAEAFPKVEVYAAGLTEGAVVGAAMVLHKHWNSQPLPSGIITLKYHTAMKHMSV